VTFGSIYLSITDAGSAGDWAIGAWALVMALGMLAADVVLIGLIARLGR
jgi:hypothetical protein